MNRKDFTQSALICKPFQRYRMPFSEWVFAPEILRLTWSFSVKPSCVVLWSTCMYANGKRYHTLEHTMPFEQYSTSIEKQTVLQVTCIANECWLDFSTALHWLSCNIVTGVSQIVKTLWRRLFFLNLERARETSNRCNFIIKRPSFWLNKLKITFLLSKHKGSLRGKTS